MAPVGGPIAARDCSTNTLCMLAAKCSDESAHLHMLALAFIVRNEISTKISAHAGTRERSGSVVECLTRDRRAAGSSLTGVTALWSLSKTHLS